MGFSAVATLIGSAVSVSEQRKTQRRTERAQKKVADLDRAQRGEESSRSRRQSAREAQVRRAQIENVSGATGQVFDSASQVSLDQVNNSFGENARNINTSLAFGDARTTANQNLLDAQRTSGLQQLADFTTQAASTFRNNKKSGE